MAPPLALTLGEPAGIGPDVAISAWLRRHELDLPPFYLLGDPACIAARAQLLGVEVPIAEATPASAAASFAEAFPIVATGHAVTAQPGRCRSLPITAARYESGPQGRHLANC